MFGMAVDEDGHISLAVRSFPSARNVARLELLGLRVVATIFGTHRARCGDHPASLDRALGVDRKGHHLPAEQSVADLKLGLFGRRARVEAPFERDARNLAVRF